MADHSINLTSSISSKENVTRVTIFVTNNLNPRTHLSRIGNAFPYLLLDDLFLMRSIYIFWSPASFPSTSTVNLNRPAEASISHAMLLSTFGPPRWA